MIVVSEPLSQDKGWKHGYSRTVWWSCTGIYDWTRGPWKPDATDIMYPTMSELVPTMLGELKPMECT